MTTKELEFVENTPAFMRQAICECGKRYFKKFPQQVVCEKCDGKKTIGEIANDIFRKTKELQEFMENGIPY